MGSFGYFQLPGRNPPTQAKCKQMGWGGNQQQQRQCKWGAHWPYLRMAGALHLPNRGHQRLGIRHLFGALIGADTLPVRKPDPAPLFEAISRVGGTPSRAVLIGDTQTDRDTGRAAGVSVALVTFGPEGSGVARMQPDALLDHYDDLAALVGRMMEN